MRPIFQVVGNSLFISMGNSFARELASSKYKKKKVIDLSNQRLEEIPPAIGNLRQCEELYLNENNLSSIPEEVLLEAEFE